MIYMPSLMKPIKESASETTSCSMLAVSTGDLHKQMCSCLRTSESAVALANAKPVPSDIRHPFYRHPTHRHHKHRIRAGIRERPKTVVPQLTVNSEITTVFDVTDHKNRIEKQLSLPGCYQTDQTREKNSSDLDLTPTTKNNQSGDIRCSWSFPERSSTQRPHSADTRSTPCLNLAYEESHLEKANLVQFPAAGESPSDPCWPGEIQVHQEGRSITPPSQTQLANIATQSDSSTQLQNLTNRLLYFPNISSKLKVQFAGTSRTDEGSMRAIFSDVSDETISRVEYEANRLPLMGKPLIGSLMPLISTRNPSIYSDRVQVLVERKGQRSSKDSPQTKVPSRRRQTIQPGTKQIDASSDSFRRIRLKSLSAWRVKQTSKLRRACGFEDQRKADPLITCGTSPAHIPRVSEHSSSTNSEDLCQDCQRVILNVSGLKFETWLAVLNNHPTTLLGDAEKRMPFYDAKRKEYFFDRHRPSFEAIFNYYQYGGRLKRPAVVADDIFLRELEFFQIEQDALESYKKNEGYVPEVIILPENQLKRKLWLLFEYPETSPLAFCFSVTSVIFTIISIILFCVETLPVYAQTHCEPGAKPNFRDPFFIIETICTIWFTFELIIRLVSCPSHKAFVKDFKNLIDLAAIVPYYITLTNVLITFSCEGAKSSASLAFLRVIRLIRVFKLTKHSSGLQILVLTFKESIEGLGLFLVAFIVCILVFSSTLYYVEIDRKGSQIESIPDAFWWAVITMCTVGYGDKVPKGPLGKIVGSVCAVAGVLTLAIPVPIITENFNKFYAHKTGRGRR